MYKRSWWRKHRTGIIAVIVVIVMIGGITAAVLATRNVGDVPAADDPSGVASSSTPATHAPTPTPTPHPTTSAPPAPPKTTATGTVVTVNAVGSWSVAVQKGFTVTVKATPTTTYPHGHKVDDVRKGSTITVVGTMSAGVITASSVTIEKKDSKKN